MCNLLLILWRPAKAFLVAIWELIVFLIIGDPNLGIRLHPTESKSETTAPNKCGIVVPMQCYDKKNDEFKDVAIYSFVYDGKKRKIYGLRHFQGWEYAGWKEIEIKYLRPRDNIEYKLMGIKQRADQIEYKENEPLVSVFGYVRIPSGNVAIVWDEEKQRLTTIRVEDLIDTIDPQYY